MEGREPKFLVDVMLGKLAKWLRVLGYDAEYLRDVSAPNIARSSVQARILVTRKKEVAEEHPRAILIHSERLEEQLKELKGHYGLRPDRSRWFTRCVNCNALLRKATLEDARDSVPEYVLYENMQDIRFCPSCRRHYWPGTHRENMLMRLGKIGF